MKILAALTLAGAILGAGSAQARVFSFNKEKFAAYFRGTGGLSEVKQETFEHSSGSQSVIDDEVQYNFSGELGFAWGFGENFVIRTGAEILQTKPLHTTGKNAAGTPLFDLTSKVFIFNPNITLELLLAQKDIFRFFAYGGLGYSFITLENEYVMQTAGTTAYGVASYTEKSGTESFSSHFGAGFEILFADTTTFSLDLGYRYLPVDRLKYKDNVTAINGNFTKGAYTVNEGVSDYRAFDMGGAYIGATFRFYISVL